MESSSHIFLFQSMLLKYFVSLTIFRKKFKGVFKVRLSFAASVYILSSEGASQLQALYIRTLGNIQGNFSTEGAVLKCIPSNFFPGNL